ncbi:MAG: DUF58 domain-containing protein [Thermoplasmata archaeon]
MRTPVSSWFTTIVAILLIVSLFTGNWLLLTLTIPFVTFIALFIIFSAPRLDVGVARGLDSRRLPEGKTIEIYIRLENKGPRISILEVFDVLPADLRVKEGSNHFATKLAPNERRDFFYKVECLRKGRYTIGPTVLRTWSLMGTTYDERILPSWDAITVTPKSEDIRKLKISPRKTRMWFGQVRSRRAGVGTDFWGIKEYYAGDDLRKINWKASARFDKLFCNQFEGERSGDAIIVLDARKESDVGLAQRTTLESGIRAAVSIAAKILETRNRVGLVIQRDVLDWVYPGYGRKQLFRIIDALVRVRPGGRWPFEHVTWVVSRFFPAQSQIIMITPLIDKKAVGCVIDLCARGHDVLIISPSPLEFGEAAKDSPESVARLTLSMERDNIIRRLRRYANVVDWETSRPLAAALKGVRPYPGRR